MDKKYYYLGADRTTPHGPYSLPELAAMLKAGALTPTTEVAAKGDAAWQPLIQLLAKHPQAMDLPPVPQEGVPQEGASDAPADDRSTPLTLPAAPQPAICPGCNAELPPQDLPVRCPVCQRLLRPESDSLWNNAKMALQQYATISGRATRTEFWSFVLFLYPFGFLYILACGIALGWLLVSLGTENATLPLIVFCSMAGLGIILALALIIPFWCALVRRLHDAGFSGRWVLLYLLLYVIGDVLTGLAYAPIFNGQLLSNIQTLESAEQADGLFNSVILEMTMAQAQGLGPWAQIISLATSALGFALFIMTFFDSQRGNNAYGLSRKYPLG